MSRLDEELRQALRRREPPEGFAERVLTRAAMQAPRRRWLGVLNRMQPPQLRWAAAVAVVVAMLIGGAQYQQQRQRQMRGEQAKQKVVLALRIAADQLELTRQKIQQLNAREILTQPQGSGRRQQP